MINPVTYNNNFSIYNNIGFFNPRHTTAPIGRIDGVYPVDEKKSINTGKVEPKECQTCKNRKYVDVSNEPNVSFKTPTKVSPAASYGAVAAHESEHVSNAINKGNAQGAKLVSVSVRMKMEICPECGTPYVAGGVTNSVIKYDESNPYESNRKAAEGSLLKGINVDFVA